MKRQDRKIKPDRGSMPPKWLLILNNDAAGSRTQVVLSYPQKLYQLSPSDREVQMQVRKSKTSIPEKNISLSVCLGTQPVQSLGAGFPKHIRASKELKVEGNCKLHMEVVQDFIQNATNGSHG
ncbi:hypothetical protein LguiA_011785 [Lonicera macranthoides]